MRVIMLAVLVLGIFTVVVSAGINWKVVWLEPSSPIILDSPGSSIPYRVKGINGANYEADLTHNRYLKVTSSDENIVGVDQESNRLIAKAIGSAKIGVSFGDNMGVVTVVIVNSK